MTSEEAIRFLHSEARACRDADAHEAFCLLLPSIMAALDLEPMHRDQALRFRHQLEKTLRAQKFARLENTNQVEQRTAA